MILASLVELEHINARLADPSRSMFALRLNRRESRFVNMAGDEIGIKGLGLYLRMHPKVRGLLLVRQPDLISEHADAHDLHALRAMEVSTPLRKSCCRVMETPKSTLKSDAAFQRSARTCWRVESGHTRKRKSRKDQVHMRPARVCALDGMTW